MDAIEGFFSGLRSEYGFWGIALMLCVLVLFVMQAWYYLGFYSSLPKYRNGKRRPKSYETDGISVIVLTGDNSWYLENILPKLLSQEHTNYEVILVEIGTSEDFSDEVAVMKERYPVLRSTRMDSDPRFPISDKMAFNVGIKAASYENIVLTTTAAYPVSPKWLSCMEQGFDNGEVVIGYCGVEPSGGIANAMMRCSRLMSSVPWLASAVEGYPFRGTIHNIGFTRKIYFDYRGFDYLNMNLGIDDLFIKRIANGYNTSIVIHPHAVMKEARWGGLDAWRHDNKFGSASFRYYDNKAKSVCRTELITRSLFYLVIIAVIVFMPLEVKGAALLLFLIRLVMVRYAMWKVRRRLGEKNLGKYLMLYDLVSPASRLWLAVSSRIRPPAGVWR